MPPLSLGGDAKRRWLTTSILGLSRFFIVTRIVNRRPKLAISVPQDLIFCSAVPQGGVRARKCVPDCRSGGSSHSWAGFLASDFLSREVDSSEVAVVG